MQIEVLGSRWKNSTKASQEEEWNVEKYFNVYFYDPWM